MVQKNEDNSELEKLVRLAAKGDRKAFSEIVRRKMKTMFALTYRMTQDREAALDLAQDCFVAAWEGLSGFRGEAKFSSWLHRIAVNKTLNYLSSKGKTKPEELNDDMASSRHNSPLQLLERDELRAGVLKFMASLPARQRIAFELRFYRQYSFSEIAETTGSALGTVKTNYREAVSKLRKVAKEKAWME